MLRAFREGVLNKSFLILFADIVLFIFLMNVLPFDSDVTLGLSILIFIGILWLTEAIHLSITALLVPVFAVFFHVYTAKSALSHFSNPVIFQFLGGFALASALRKQQLDKAMANKVLQLARGKMQYAVLMLFALTACLSMWISNTATIAMMVPLVLGLLSNLDAKSEKRTYVFVLLGIAYSASIGGMATLIGTPSNAIAAAEVGLNFGSWLFYGLPISLILLPLVIFISFVIIRPTLKHTFKVGAESVIWDAKKITTILIFAIIVSLWVFGKSLVPFFGAVDDFDGMVGVFAAILVCAFHVVKWSDVKRDTEWGILILFGGGLCLSAVLSDTGASTFLALEISNLVNQLPLYVSLLIITVALVFLTEFASNTATAALFIPVLVTVASQLNISPVVVSVLAGVATSCAFMLPAATPANAFVYSTNFVPLRAMLRVGFVMNIIISFVLCSYAYFVWV
jgi:solute carrier family 13 (sodium-dependent dicarboxylate transporter), member 2/3/5